MPKLLLEPLKKYPVQLAGITSMVDSGGASGEFRKQFGVLPPGDIRRLILALSNAPEWKKQLWTFRFGNEVFGVADGDINRHKGQCFANAFIAGLEWTQKSYRKAIAIVSFSSRRTSSASPMSMATVTLKWGISAHARLTVRAMAARIRDRGRTSGSGKGSGSAFWLLT